MRALVTGSAGFIGSHMAEALASLGHEVIGVDCVSDYYSVAQKELNIKDIKKAGVKFIKKDLAKDDLSKIVDGVEVVFHFSAQPGISSHVSFDEYNKNNTVATFKLLEVLKNSKTLKLFVQISTSSVYGLYAKGNEATPPSPASFYGVTKLASEQLAMSYFYSHKMPVSVFRLFSVYGERERSEKFWVKLIASILNNKEVPFYQGSEKHVRSYTYVKDVTDGLIRALEKKEKCIGQIFNLGTENAITTAEGIKIVEGIIGKKAKLKILEKRAGDQLETHADVSKIKKILGFSPKTTQKEGLKNEVEWVKRALKAGVKL